jgi:hypothetical protein
MTDHTKFVHTNIVARPGRGLRSSMNKFLKEAKVIKEILRALGTLVAMVV